MKQLLSALLRYFIKGLLIVVPLGAAFLLIFWAVKSIDDALNLSGMLWTDPKTGKPVYIPGDRAYKTLVLPLA
jgi:uncharacterized membrane protein